MVRPKDGANAYSEAASANLPDPTEPSNEATSSAPATSAHAALLHAALSTPSIHCLADKLRSAINDHHDKNEVTNILGELTLDDRQRVVKDYVQKFKPQESNIVTQDIDKHFDKATALRLESELVKPDGRADLAGEVRVLLHETLDKHKQANRDLVELLSTLSSADIAQLRLDYQSRYHESLDDSIRNYGQAISATTSRSLSYLLKGFDGRTIQDNIDMARIGIDGGNLEGAALVGAALRPGLMTNEAARAFLQNDATFKSAVDRFAAKTDKDKGDPQLNAIVHDYLKSGRISPETIASFDKNKDGKKTDTTDASDKEKHQTSKHLDLVDLAHELIKSGKNADYSEFGQQLQSMDVSQKARLYDEYANRYGGSLSADMLKNIPPADVQNFRNLLSLTPASAQADYATAIFNRADHEGKVEDGSNLALDRSIGLMAEQLQQSSAAGTTLSPELLARVNRLIGEKEQDFEKARDKYNSDHQGFWSWVGSELSSLGGRIWHDIQHPVDFLRDVINYCPLSPIAQLHFAAWGERKLEAGLKDIGINDLGVLGFLAKINDAESDFIEAAAYSAVQQPLTGLAQLADKAFGTHIAPNLNVIQLKDAKFGSLDWFAQTIGQGFGYVVPFIATAGATGALDGSLSAASRSLALADEAGELSAGGDLALRAANLGSRLLESGSMSKNLIDGFLVGSVLQPAQGKGNFWEQRFINGGIGTASMFGVQAVTSPLLDAGLARAMQYLPLSARIADSAYTAAVSRAIANGASLSLGSIANAELSTRGEATPESLYRTALGAAVTGVALDATINSRTHAAPTRRKRILPALAKMPPPGRKRSARRDKRGLKSCLTGLSTVRLTHNTMAPAAQ